jgi:ABC-type dipeptide/oligopeptide/nickel transport system permease component
MLPDNLTRCGKHITNEMMNRIYGDFGLVANPDVFDWIYMFGRFVAKSLSGEFGVSFLTQKPASVVMQERFPNTGLLLITTILVSTVIMTLRKKRGKSDLNSIKKPRLGRFIPVFWTAMVFLYFFSFLLQESLGIGFPQFGTISYEMWEMARLDQFGFGFLLADILFHLILPVTSLTFFLITSNNSLADILSDALTDSRNNYESEMVPSNRSQEYMGKQTLAAVGKLVSSALLVEVVFSWRGIGRLFFDSLLLMDFPVLQACFVYFSLLIVGIHLFSDLFVSFLKSNKRPQLLELRLSMEREFERTRIRLYLLSRKRGRGVDPAQMMRGGHPIFIETKLRDRLLTRLRFWIHP